MLYINHWIQFIIFNKILATIFYLSYKLEKRWYFYAYYSVIFQNDPNATSTKHINMNMSFLIFSVSQYLLSFIFKSKIAKRQVNRTTIVTQSNLHFAKLEIFFWWLLSINWIANHTLYQILQLYWQINKINLQVDFYIVFVNSLNKRKRTLTKCLYSIFLITFNLHVKIFSAF